ncbi:hypothetical protein FOXYSP1_14460 [Fusarium oxysporum f. sp. phaseoli]
MPRSRYQAPGTLLYSVKNMPEDASHFGRPLQCRDPTQKCTAYPVCRIPDNEAYRTLSHSQMDIIWAGLDSYFGELAPCLRHSIPVPDSCTEPLISVT